ncbi:MAG: class II aldolase/adducin family protein, partial [Candidatus Cloacimonetes bacterium]|nr:class II aldolase/adducin family protein [Candidatus Cloacimonadota bacterium]
MSIYDKLDFSKYFEAPEFKTLLEGIAEISACIYRKNWAEANAGNISINVSEEIDTINLRYSIRPPLPYAKWYLVSKSGSRYRELAKQAHPHLVLIAVEGRQQLVFPNDARPTSEWVSHLSIQQGFSRNKVIIHTHPTEIIAL